jgi:hypothetical protein
MGLFISLGYGFDLQFSSVYTSSVYTKKCKQQAMQRLLDEQ